MDVKRFLEKVCERPKGFTEVRRDGKDQDAVVNVIRNEIKNCKDRGMPDHVLCKHIQVFASSAWVSSNVAAQHIATLRGLSPQGGASLTSLAAAGAALVNQQDSGISTQTPIADSSEIERDEDETSPTPNADMAGHHQASNSDEPTDLTLDADEKARLRERLEREQRSILSVTTTATKISQQSPDESQLRDREDLNGRPAFDFRRLMPQSMSVKSENC